MESKYLILSIFILFTFFNGFAQEEENGKTDLLLSIYIAKLDYKEFNFEKTIKDKLDLKNFNLLVDDLEDVNSSFFTLNTSNLGKTASEFSLESYKNTFSHKYFKGYNPKK